MSPPIAADAAEVVLAPEPFSTRVERLEAREGATVAFILTEACRLGALDPTDLARAEVYLDGIRLEDREAALDLAPAPGQLLNIAVLPQGGGGEGNKVLTTILQVALVAATAWIAGPAAPGVATALHVGTTAVRVGALALQLAGTAAITALAQPLAGHGPDGFEEFGA